MAAMAQDKKIAEGRLTLILARGLGKAFLARDVELQAVRKFLAGKLG
jgi:3-dehydroquinate synthetase